MKTKFDAYEKFAKIRVQKKDKTKNKKKSLRSHRATSQKSRWDD